MKPTLLICLSATSLAACMMPGALAADSEEARASGRVIRRSPGSTAAATAGTATYTMSQIQSSSSLSAINGKVVDLSSWVNQHPGGAAPIRGRMCAVDLETVPAPY